jgi:hypothetical protein
MTDDLKIIEPAIEQLLKTLANGQIYHLRAPQGVTGSFIIFQQVDSDRWETLDGPTRVALSYQRIDAYAVNSYDAIKLGAQIEKILDGYVGRVYHGDDSPQEYVDIADLKYQNTFDLLDDNEEPFMFRNSAVYLINYNQ